MSSFFAVQIAGSKTMFTERAEPSISGYDQYLGITSVVLGSSTLDLKRRRATGETLVFKVRDTQGEVRALVQPRRLPSTALTVNYPGATVLTMGSTSGLTSPVYIGAESFTFTGSTATTLTGVARGQFGSDEQAHLAGDGVYQHPPTWTSRKVTLYENGTAIGTYRLEQPPQYLGGEMWEFRATSIVDWFAKRKILSGVAQVRPGDDRGLVQPVVFKDTDDVKAVGDKSPELLLFFALESGAAHIVQPVAGGVAEEISWTDPGLLEPNYRDFEELVTPQLSDNTVIPIWSSAQLAVHVQGDAAIEAMKLINSGSGTTYDVYPESPATQYDGREWNVGAGLEVDLSDLIGSARWSQVLTETTTVEEVLYEVCLATGSYWYGGTDGTIKVAPLRERVPPSVVVGTYNDPLMRSVDALSVSEDEVYHTVTLKCNWDPVQQDYLLTVNVFDREIKHLWPETSRSLELESKFIRADVSGWGAGGPGGQTYQGQANMSRDEVEGLLRRVQRYSVLPKADYQTIVTGLGSAPGTVVSATNARIPDLSGGTLSGSFLVMSRKRDLDRGTANMTLRLVEPGYLFAVAVEVGSVAGAVVTPAVNDFWTGLDSLNEGWTVEAPERAGVTRTIDTIGGSTFTMSSSIASLAPGDILIVRSGSGSNTDGILTTDYAYQDGDTRWS